MIGSFETWWNSSLAQSWGATLLHFTWQGMLVAAACQIHLRLLRAGSARSRYLAACGWLGVLVTAPVATFILMATQPMALPWPPMEPAIDRAVAGDLAADWHLASSADVTGNMQSTPGNMNVLSMLGDRWMQWWVLGWAGGVVILSLRLVGGGCALWWLRRQVAPLPANLTESVAILRRRLGTPTRVVVGVSSKVSSAIACGILRPMVLIPTSWLLDLSPTMLQAVIAHELAHIRRYDLWINFCQRVAETIWFYHPAVWWISSVVRRERETCCDELAVAATECRVAYARTLEYLAARRLTGTAPQWLSTGMGEDRMALLQRVKHILGTNELRSSAGYWPAVLAVLSLAFVAAMLLRAEGTAVAGEQSAQENSSEQSEEHEEGEGGVYSLELVKQSGEAGENDRDEEVRRLRTELDRSTARLRDYEETMDRLVREFARTRALLESQEKALQSLRQAIASGDGQKWRRSHQESSRSAPDGRSAPDERMTAQLEIERELVAHRRRNLEKQIEEERKRFEEDLHSSVESEVQKQSRQLEYERQLAHLEAERAELEHNRRAREVQLRMEQTARQRKRAKEDDVQQELDHQLAVLQSELESIETERALSRKFREVEIHAKEAEIDPRAIKQRIEGAVYKELHARISALEAQLEELTLQQKRLELERARLK